MLKLKSVWQSGIKIVTLYIGKYKIFYHGKSKKNVFSYIDIYQENNFRKRRDLIKLSNNKKLKPIDFKTTIFKKKFFALQF